MQPQVQKKAVISPEITFKFSPSSITYILNQQRVALNDGEPPTKKKSGPKSISTNRIKLYIAFLGLTMKQILRNYLI